MKTCYNMTVSRILLLPFSVGEFSTEPIRHGTGPESEHVSKQFGQLSEFTACTWWVWNSSKLRSAVQGFVEKKKADNVQWGSRALSGRAELRWRRGREGEWGKKESIAFLLVAFPASVRPEDVRVNMSKSNFHNTKIPLQLTQLNFRRNMRRNARATSPVVVKIPLTRSSRH